MSATRFTPTAVLSRVGFGRGRPEAALVVPVPAASGVIARVLGERRVKVAGLPPHVTLIYPFVSPALIDDCVEEGIAEIAGRFSCFRFRLARAARFPGVLYLEPEPAHPFVALTEAMVERWPHHPPYGGRHAEVVPHVTVLTGREPPGVAASLEEALPVDCEAEHVQLLVQDQGRRWQAKRQISLGGAP